MNRLRTPQRARYGLRKAYVAVSIGKTPQHAANRVFSPLSNPDRYLVGAAWRRDTACRSCGWHTNPTGCCRKACAAYSGVPF